MACGSGAAVRPTISDFLSAALLAAMSLFGTSKSVVMPRYPTVDIDAPVLHMWILNHNVRYASTLNRAGGLGMKVAFKVISRSDADMMLESMTLGVQEINFPQAAIDAAIRVLRQDNSRLAPGERTLLGFHIGLLQRWPRT